jgi:HPr kinase/phosphorylase
MVSGRAVMIIGKSGAGKTALMLEMMALGAEFIGDDQVFVEIGEDITIHPHSNAKGRLEMRGVGIFETKSRAQAKLELVVNLDQEPSTRLPQKQHFEIGDSLLPKIDGKGVHHLASFLYLFLKGDLKTLEGAI